MLNRLYIFLITINLLLSISCKHKRYTIVDKQDIVIDTALTEQIIDSSNFSLSDLAENKSFNLQDLKQINFGTDSLSDSLVIYSIFGSEENSNQLADTENEFVSAWKCTSCETHIFDEPNEYNENEGYTKDTLPYPQNFTKITQKQYFKDANNNNVCLVSFSTSSDYPPCGRFSSGLLSLALFHKTDKHWKLLNLNLFVNYQGSFSTAHTFNKIDKNWIIIKGGIATGPPFEDYSPVYSNYYFIDLKTLTQKIYLEDIDCWNNGKISGTEWTSNYSIENEQIKFIIEGKIDKKNFWGLSHLNKIPKSNFEKLPRKFKFKIVKIFNLSTNQFVDKLENIEIVCGKSALRF